MNYQNLINSSTDRELACLIAIVIDNSEGAILKVDGGHTVSCAISGQPGCLIRRVYLDNQLMLEIVGAMAIFRWSCNRDKAKSLAQKLLLASRLGPEKLARYQSIRSRYLPDNRLRPQNTRAMTKERNADGRVRQKSGSFARPQTAIQKLRAAGYRFG